MRETIEITAVLDETGLSLEDLCRLSTVTPQWVAERIDAGLLAATRDDVAALRFDAVTIRRVQSMARLERDFDAVPELAALVADLEAEVRRLRARLRAAGLQ